jgi:hypothetical protein
LEVECWILAGVSRAGNLTNAGEGLALAEGNVPHMALDFLGRSRIMLKKNRLD